MHNLKGKTVAILATDGFEESELRRPLTALKDAGAQVDIVAPDPGKITGWSNGNWSDSEDVDVTVSEAFEKEYNALVLPGGVINPDKLRRHDQSVQFVRKFFKEHKPVAAICHAPQVLIEAEVLKDRKITSFSSIKTDAVNAGAHWVDEAVVVDEGLVTSRTPDDLDAFCDKLLEEVAEGKHEEQTV